jgi:hypothetical protein
MRLCSLSEAWFSILSVIGGTMASIRAARTSCVTRHKELVAPASKSA